MLGLLPSYKSSRTELLEFFNQVGARLRRNLRQDEFGPTRADRIASLRQLVRAVDKVVAQANAAPPSIRDQLEQALDARTPSDGTLNSILTVVLETAAELEEAASVRRDSRSTRACRNLKQAAERTLYMVEALDTATAAEIFEEEVAKPGDKLAAGELSQRLTRHAALYSRTLERLKRGRGAESHNSVHILVWDLAYLWTHETGLPVTSNAVKDYSYTASPRSGAGRFIVTAFDILFQATSEMDDPARHPDSWVAKLNHPAARRRAVYFSMRKYVQIQRAQRPED